MNIIISIIVFVLGLGILIKSSDYFTESAEKIGKIIGLPQFIIGIIIISIGTSLPELATSIMAAIQNSTTIAIGNVIGSNIANLCLILGLSAIIVKKIKVKHNLIKVDLPLLMGSVLLLYFTTIDGIFSLSDAIIMLLVFGIYLKYATSKKEITTKKVKLEKKTIKITIVLIVSAILIYLGAKLTIDGVISIANILKINPAIIAITAIAIGTSLPELSVSLIALKKKKFDILLGNILGSNIINSTLVIGIPGLIRNLKIDNMSIMLGLPFILGITLWFIIMALDKEINEYEGSLMMLAYILFLVLLFRTVIGIN